MFILSKRIKSTICILKLVKLSFKIFSTSAIIELFRIVSENLVIHSFQNPDI